MASHRRLVCNKELAVTAGSFAFAPNHRSIDSLTRSQLTVVRGKCLVCQCQLLTPFRSAKYSRRTGGGALWSGADGPRPGAGRSVTWCRSLGPLPDDRTVRALRPDGPRPEAGRSARAQGRRKSPAAAWISLPGGTPSGRRDPRGCLGSGRST
jgi:hypothetical protein